MYIKIQQLRSTLDKNDKKDSDCSYNVLNY